jgi:hypothetical protein
MQQPPSAAHLVQNEVVFGFTALKVHGILTNKAEAWK